MKRIFFRRSGVRNAAANPASTANSDLYRGATGRGHATDQGVLLGLLGEAPDTVQPESVAARLAAVRRERVLPLLGSHPVGFDSRNDIATARAAGIPCVCVPFGYTDVAIETLEPDLIIQHFDALAAAVRQVLAQVPAHS